MNKFTLQPKLFFGFAGLIVFLFLFNACDPGRVYEENQVIETGSWAQNKPIKFEIPVSDTVNYHKIFINVRNSGAYEYSNLFLFVKTHLPNGSVSADTVECTLSDLNGKWLGSGLGDVFNNQILFKKHVRFPRSGKYEIEVEQAMRIDPLAGIQNIGIRLEKERNNK